MAELATLGISAFFFSSTILEWLLEPSICLASSIFSFLLSLLSFSLLLSLTRIDCYWYWLLFSAPSNFTESLLTSSLSLLISWFSNWPSFSSTVNRLLELRYACISLFLACMLFWTDWLDFLRFLSTFGGKPILTSRGEISLISALLPCGWLEER